MSKAIITTAPIEKADINELLLSELAVMTIGKHCVICEHLYRTIEDALAFDPIMADHDGGIACKVCLEAKP